MATYIVLIDFTEKGVDGIENSIERSASFKELAAKTGIKVRDTFWTMGEHDGVLIFEAPDDESASAAMLTLARQGYVRTKTLRAFERNDIEKIISKIGS